MGETEGERERKEGARKGGRKEGKKGGMKRRDRGGLKDRRKRGKERRTRRRKKMQGSDQNRLFRSVRKSTSGSDQALGTQPLPFSHYRKRAAKMRNYHRRGWILGLIVLNQSTGAGMQGEVEIMMPMSSPRCLFFFFSFFFLFPKEK